MSQLFDPNWQRASILPVGRNKQTGQLAPATPQVMVDLLSALMLPGDVYKGNVLLNDPETGHTNMDVIKRSADLAGAVTLGAGAIPAQGTLRMGAKLPPRAEAFRKYMSSRKWDTPEEARRQLMYYVDKWNKPDQMDMIMGRTPEPMPPDILDQIGIVKRQGKWALSQAGTNVGTKKALELSDNPIGRAPQADWGGKDMQDYRKTAKANEVVKEAYVPLEQVPQAKLAGGKTGYGWDELNRFNEKRDAIPPVTLRQNKNGSVSIIDGNHRIQWFRDQGFDSIPAYVIGPKK
jgi:hypothetical protein